MGEAINVMPIGEKSFKDIVELIFQGSIQRMKENGCSALVILALVNSIYKEKLAEDLRKHMYVVPAKQESEG